MTISPQPCAMIKETIKIHDNYQFEIKQSYNLSLDNKTSNSYFVQTYFFIPNNLNINRETYSRTDFYKDLRATIRLKTPAMLLKNLAADTESIPRMRRSVEDLLASKTRQSVSNYEYHVKMFCLVYKKAIGTQLRFLKKTDKSKDCDSLVTEFIACVDDVKARFRQLKPIIITDRLSRKLQTVYLFADEYISLKTETHACRLLEILKEKQPRLYNKHYRRLMDMVHGETAYRIQSGYPSVPSPGGDNEKFVFRQGALKKFLSNILYLETRVEHGGKFLEQAVYSIAAGVAMIFATMVAFIGQSWYGSLSLPFFIALVISYMFKDRMKELLRLYLSVTLRKWLYDRQRTIYHSFDQKIGTCKESFNIITDSGVPAKIIEYRSRDSITDINNSMTGETVILYRKYIRLSAKNFNKIRHRHSTNDVIDIMRFNIQHFLRSMDNPEKKIFIPLKSGYRKAFGMRVYHINMITHFIIDRQEYLRRFRIVLNRNGIRRIEEVV
ncbi:MAG TPA: hypothetical protein PLM53_15120 [Spirochaetota bacterium]|nr:hypothetical protein [Spirochaetota bacterium]HPC42133.1 hypothetical protein [Spirochaetota bacterium]HPL18070.1 hypothetical protein [Spirochaetota bacterium]HQF09695.1 hypothetical protein [Spirochaetota bacterium]HQH98427.1 hypothetical protein [Spirochaetota bacterium]